MDAQVRLPKWVLTFVFNDDGLECKFIFSTYKKAQGVSSYFPNIKTRIEPIDKKWAFKNIDKIKPFVDNGQEFIEQALGEILTDWRKRNAESSSKEDTAKV